MIKINKNAMVRLVISTQINITYVIHAYIFYNIQSIRYILLLKLTLQKCLIEPQL